MRKCKVFICLAVSLFLLSAIIACSESQSRKELAATIIELSRNAKYTQALVQADRYIEKYNKDSFGYAAKGSVLSSMYRVEEAIENYNKALQYIPDTRKKGLTYENIANNYIRLNRFDDAIKYYRSAIEADSRLSASSMLGISNAYILAGDMVKALSFYKQAGSRLDESEIRLREAQASNRGMVYMKAAWLAYQFGRNDDALEYAEKGKNLRNNDIARLAYASYLARLGNKNKSAQEFASVNVDNCPAEMLALYYLFTGNIEKASQYFNISYTELQTSDQINIWKLSIKRDAMYPHDDWASARKQDWFKAKIQG